MTVRIDSRQNSLNSLKISSIPSSSTLTLSCISLSFRQTLKKYKKNFKFLLQFLFSQFDFKLDSRFDSKIPVLWIRNFDSRFDCNFYYLSTFSSAVSLGN